MPKPATSSTSPARPLPTPSANVRRSKMSVRPDRNPPKNPVVASRNGVTRARRCTAVVGGSQRRAATAATIGATSGRIAAPPVSPSRADGVVERERHGAEQRANGIRDGLVPEKPAMDPSARRAPMQAAAAHSATRSKRPPSGSDPCVNAARRASSRARAER